LQIPKDRDSVEIDLEGKKITLTNLRKIFWPDLGITKGDLLQFYADVAPVLLPHLANRAMVMKRYPHGIAGEFFFMKRAPSPRPHWIET
jgi:bifunctional non-homologous end joining protein LigD